METIEKLLLDIILVKPKSINNNIFESSLLQESIIIVRKHLKKKGKKIYTINQLFDELCIIFPFNRLDHYRYIHIFIKEYFETLFDRYRGYYYSREKNFEKLGNFKLSLKLVDKNVENIIEEWMSINKELYLVCGYSTYGILCHIKRSLNNYRCIERCIRFVFSFFKPNTTEKYLYDIYCLIKDSKEMEKLKKFLPPNQLKLILDSYNKYLSIYLEKQSILIDKVNVIYEKFYCLEDHGCETRYNMVLYNGKKIIDELHHILFGTGILLDKEDIKKYIKRNDYILKNDCDIEMIDKKIPIPYIKIEIDNSKCKIFDEKFGNLLDEYQLNSNIDKELIYCDAIRRLIKDKIIAQKYEMKIICN